MAARKTTEGVKPERVRAFWAERQGMAGGMRAASAEEVLARTGWARSVGGCNPYLVLRDRARLSRATVDQAVAALDIHELPAARGCTYVVPKRDFAIALRASQGHGDDATMAMARKFLGVTDKEIDKLMDRVVAVVTKEPLDPAGIKEVVGDLARSLGAEGKKRGTTSTLPIALGRLQTQGMIRRVPVDGRLDQQRYRYVAWTPGGPGKTAKTATGLSDDELAIELARRFFRWAGPATVAQLAWWAGLGVKVARAAAAEVKVVPLEEGSERLLLPEDRDALLALEIPKEPRVAFVSSLDNLFHMRRGEVRTLLDGDDIERKVPANETSGETLGGLAELPYNAIVDRGRLVGLWEWDGLKGALVWRLFAKTPGIEKRAAAEAEAFTAYVKSDLGDVRSFSLDSPEKRAPSVAALAKAKWTA
jgi:hypothetical protein